MTSERFFKLCSRAPWMAMAFPIPAGVSMLLITPDFSIPWGFAKGVFRLFVDSPMRGWHDTGWVGTGLFPLDALRAEGLDCITGRDAGHQEGASQVIHFPASGDRAEIIARQVFLGVLLGANQGHEETFSMGFVGQPGFDPSGECVGQTSSRMSGNDEEVPHARCLGGLFGQL